MVTDSLHPVTVIAALRHATGHKNWFRCAICGVKLPEKQAEVWQGRSRDYCSSPCRQKAYRLRKTLIDPITNADRRVDVDSIPSVTKRPQKAEPRPKSRSESKRVTKRAVESPVRATRAKAPAGVGAGSRRKQQPARPRRSGRSGGGLAFEIVATADCTCGRYIKASSSGWLTLRVEQQPGESWADAYFRVLREAEPHERRYSPGQTCRCECGERYKKEGRELVKLADQLERKP